MLANQFGEADGSCVITDVPAFVLIFSPREYFYPVDREAFEPEVLT